MDIKIGDYQITSDSLQFIVNKKSIVKEGIFTKAENIGKETYKPVAYAVKFEQALSFIPQDTIRNNDDINIIKDKLDQISEDIKTLIEYPVIFIKQDDEITIKTERYEQLKVNEVKLKDLKDAGVEKLKGFDETMVNYYKNKSNIDLEEVNTDE